MKDLLGELDLQPDQATCIARAMWHVAEAEAGVHEKEREMIEEFYKMACGVVEDTTEAVTARPWDVDEANRLLDSTELKELMLSSCFLLGYADGRCSEIEKDVIASMAHQLGMSDALVAGVERDVKRLLLAPFEQITVFREAAYEIAAKQLGLSAQEVDELLDSKGEADWILQK